MAPPSPRTMPSRSQSKGRTASVGASLRRERARKFPKLASEYGVTPRSHAPAKQTSTHPISTQSRSLRQGVISAGAGGRNSHDWSAQFQSARGDLCGRWARCRYVVDQAATAANVGVPM